MIHHFTACYGGDFDYTMAAYEKECAKQDACDQDEPKKGGVVHAGRLIIFDYSI
jgi:hypothetical protein